MVDRLCENMLILTVKNRKRRCNSTLCNLNYHFQSVLHTVFFCCNSTLCNLNDYEKISAGMGFIVVIVHYVI